MKLAGYWILGWWPFVAHSKGFRAPTCFVFLSRDRTAAKTLPVAGAHGVVSGGPRLDVLAFPFCWVTLSSPPTQV